MDYLIAGNFLSTAAGINTGSSSPAITTSDLVKFLFIKNTGTTDGSTASTESIVICLDGGTAAHNLADGNQFPYGVRTDSDVSNLCQYDRSNLTEFEVVKIEL